jgi:dipeptidyl aminopeptidase/acylaminoacyl peptidase
MNENRIAITRFQVVNRHGDPIHGELRYIDGRKHLPLLIICHSFMAFKEWGFFPYAAGWLAAEGFAVLTFNFSLNGVEGDNNRITHFDAFASNTFTRELEDLRRIVDAVFDEEVGETVVDRGRIGLTGHSRGGGIVIVHASTDGRIRALATWSAIATFDRWTLHQKSEWRRNGVLPLAKDSTVSPLRLGIGLLEDVETHAAKLDIGKAAGMLGIPWLIVHGAEDMTVRLREAETLYERSVKKFTKLVVLEHAGHLYSAATETQDGYSTFNKVLSLTSNWFQRHLNME